MAVQGVERGARWKVPRIEAEIDRLAYDESEMRRDECLSVSHLESKSGSSHAESDSLIVDKREGSLEIDHRPVGAVAILNKEFSISKHEFGVDG